MENLIVGSIVVAALMLTVRHFVRMYKGDKSCDCGSSCGCGPSKKTCCSGQETITRKMPQSRY